MTQNFGDTNISYFFSLDVIDDRDPQMLLAGDDNFIVNGKPVQPGILNLSSNTSIEWTAERHKARAGNIVLADGSVQTTSSSSLRQWVQQIGSATNRLVIP